MRFFLVVLGVCRARPHYHSQHSSISRLARAAHGKNDGLDEKDLDAARRTAAHAINGAVAQCRRSVREYGHVARTVLGASLLFHGGEVATTVLLVQTLRQTGLPQLRATSAELVERFEETMSAVAREAPTLRASHASLVRLESEAADVKKALDAVCASRARGALDAKQYRKQRASLQKEMRELAQEAHRASAGASALGHVLDALEPETLKQLATSTWQTTLACVATATQPSAGAITMGLALGDDLGVAARSALLPLVFSPSALPPTTLEKWSRGALQSATQGVAVLAAFKRRQLTLTLSSAALGARLVLDGVRAPVARLAGRDVIQEGQPGFFVAAAALTALGFAAQLQAQLSIVPFFPLRNKFQPLRLVLTPAFLTEAALKGLASKNILASVALPP